MYSLVLGRCFATILSAFHLDSLSPVPRNERSRNGHYQRIFCNDTATPILQLSPHNMPHKRLSDMESITRKEYVAIPSMYHCLRVAIPPPPPPPS